MAHKLSVLIEHDEHGYYAWCPQLKGCHSQGDTFEEAAANIREVVALYLETLDDDDRATLLSKEVYSTAISVDVA